MRQINKIKDKLLDLGWDIDELIYEQSIPSTNNGEGGNYRPAVVLVKNGYCLGIVDTPPVGESLLEFSDRFAQLAKSLAIAFYFVFYDEKFYRLNGKGELSLCQSDSPAAAELIADLVSRQGLTRERDPRFAPVSLPSKRHLRVPQVFAVSRVIDAILEGRRSLSVSMVLGSGKTITLATVVAKLLNSGFVKRILCLTPSAALSKQIREIYSQMGLEASVHSSETRINDQQIVILTTNKLLAISDQRSSSLVTAADFDVIVADEAQFLTKGRLVEEFKIEPHQILIGFTAVPLLGPPFTERPVYQYTMSDVLDEPIVPPGYEAHELSSFAEVTGGLPKGGARSVGPLQPVYIITNRDVREYQFVSSGFEIIEVDSDSLKTYELLENDILVSAAGATQGVALLGSLDRPAIFSDSLLRVRSKDRDTARVLFEFLSSDVGASTLSRLAYGTVLRHLTVSALMKALIYLPKSQPISRDDAPMETDTFQPKVANQLRKEVSAIHVLRDEVIPMLERNAHAVDQDAEYSSPSRNDLVAARLKQLAIELAGSNIADVVLDSFPFPIAIAYRRYVDSRFNVFERVLRLRDLAESCAFFLYNVCLADYFRNLASSGYMIENKGARLAYNGFSMAARIDFVEKIIDESNDGKKNGLFLVELPNAKRIVTNLRVLQEDLRNNLSHTAAATESQQRNILEAFIPRVMGLLKDLSFIAGYNMVRIPGYYADNGKLYRRLEIYSGAVPHIEEQEIASPNIAVSISKDHLVILNPEGQMLNLHPLYQLVSNDDTRHETHLCLFKQRKKEKGALEGESIHGSFYVELSGYDYFESLIPGE